MRSLPTSSMNTIVLVFGLRLQFLILFTKCELILIDFIIIIEGKCVSVRQFSEFEARPSSYFSSFPYSNVAVFPFPNHLFWFLW